MRGLLLVVLAGCVSTKTLASAPVSPAPVSRLEPPVAADDEAGAQVPDGKHNSLHKDVAVRHRRVLSWSDILVTSGGSGAAAVGQGAASPPPPAQPLDSPEPVQPEKLVVEVWLELVAENVGQTVEAIRTRVA